ncbi:hypothetical protein [Vibrio splendidus]|nr:hypothetical protein [Vibrio splendidus]
MSHCKDVNGDSIKKRNVVDDGKLNTGIETDTAITRIDKIQLG